MSDVLSRPELHRARAVAATVTDPEMPMLTLVDLGVLREVEAAADGTIVVTITPTYSGCPAMATIRDDLRRALRNAGFDAVEIRTQLAPAWSTDWITDDGLARLAAHGIAPPQRAPAAATGPVPLTLTPYRPEVHCPRCGAADTECISRFGATACRSLHRCGSCGEPFDRIKEL